MSAQHNLDNIILNLLGKDKFFIEAGGSHPVDQNNTYLLEQNGWKGLIVEPKTDFNYLYKELRPNSIVENYALVSNEYNSETIEADFDIYMMGSIYDIFSMSKTLKHYPAIQLHKLLTKHNIKKVDFISLDVEGYELEILKGINFNECFISYILIESHIVNGSKINFEEYLNNNGFILIEDINKNLFGSNSYELYKNINE
jgi:FkbM family methyltransferase